MMEDQQQSVDMEDEEDYNDYRDQNHKQLEVSISSPPPMEIVKDRVPLSPPPPPPTEDDESLDPRIQGELERLNKSSSEINKMENELDEAKQLFNNTRARQIQRFEFLQKKFGTCIAKSKPYFDCLAQIERLKTDSRQSVKEFERANSLYKTAKETLAVAEANLIQNSQPANSNPSQLRGMSSSTSCPDVWQEHMSSTITKINASKRNLDQAEDNHRHKTVVFQAAELRGQTLERELRRHINKAQSYYDEKKRWDTQMEAQKSRIDDLEKALCQAKLAYNGAMVNLSKISEEIHEKRNAEKEKKLSKSLPSRESGVGASDCLGSKLHHPGSPSSSFSDGYARTEQEATRCPIPTLDEEEEEEEEEEPEFKNDHQVIKGKSEPSLPPVKDELSTIITKKQKQHIQPNSLSLDPSTLSNHLQWN